MTRLTTADQFRLISRLPAQRRNPIIPHTFKALAHFWLPRYAIALVAIGEIVFPVPAGAVYRFPIVDSHQFAAHPHLVETVAVAAGVAVRSDLKLAIPPCDEEVDISIEGSSTGGVDLSNFGFLSRLLDLRNESVESHPSVDPSLGNLRRFCGCPYRCTGGHCCEEEAHLDVTIAGVIRV
jgi:hypothetical protein